MAEFHFAVPVSTPSRKRVQLNFQKCGGGGGGPAIIRNWTHQAVTRQIFQKCTREQVDGNTPEIQILLL